MYDAHTRTTDIHPLLPHSPSRSPGNCICDAPDKRRTHNRARHAFILFAVFVSDVFEVFVFDVICDAPDTRRTHNRARHAFILFAVFESDVFEVFVFDM
jgi:hypothetical protein